MQLSLFRKYLPILILPAMVNFCSCNEEKNRIANNLYRQKDYLIKEFNNKSIIHRGKNFIMLSYYQNQKVNNFFFEKAESNFILTNDTLQYPISGISSLALINKADSINYRLALVAEVKKILSKMKALHIKDVSAEFAPMDVDIKIYFGNNDVLLYVSNPAAIKNTNWLNYINGARIKFDNNWYYTKDE